MKRIAILASGNGTNFEIIAKKIATDKIRNVKLELLFSNKKNAYVLKRAKNWNVQTICFEINDFPSRAQYNDQLLKTLIAHKIDLVICAGYMVMIPEKIIKHFENKIINIHPSYLPEFKGMNAIEKAYKSDSEYTGVSIHYVVAEMDAGKILFQKKIKIDREKSLDYLEEQIHKVEYKYYYKTINKLINKRNF